MDDIKKCLGDKVKSINKIAKELKLHRKTVSYIILTNKDSFKRAVPLSHGSNKHKSYCFSV